MLLHLIAQDKWTVLTQEKTNGDIPLLDFLEDGRNNLYKRAMLGMLRRKVPTEGAPKNPLQSGNLGDGIYEFKRSPEKGTGVRVAFFYDRNYLIICTHGFLKDQRKTDREEIKRAKKFRKKYFDDKEKGLVEIL